MEVNLEKEKKTQISIKILLGQKITSYATILSCLHISIMHLGNLKECFIYSLSLY